MNIGNRIIAAVLLTFVGSVASTAFAADHADSGMEQMIENARTRTDHEALARQYEADATDLLARADRHERMGQRYAGIEAGGGKGPKFAAHCKALAEDFRSAAQENRELAALHRELAAAAAH